MLVWFVLVHESVRRVGCLRVMEACQPGNFVYYRLILGKTSFLRKSSKGGWRELNDRQEAPFTLRICDLCMCRVIHMEVSPFLIAFHLQVN